MNNIDKAAQIIRDSSEVDGETLGYAHSHNIANDLADAGLITPDLPEPQEHGGKLIWPLQDRDGFVTAIGGSVFLNDERGPVLTVDKNVARELGHIFLAATNQEGSQE